MLSVSIYLIVGKVRRDTWMNKKREIFSAVCQLQAAIYSKLTVKQSNKTTRETIKQQFIKTI